MPNVAQLEDVILSSEYYFSNVMDDVATQALELRPVNGELSVKADNLYYSIEALKFLVDRDIDTTNELCKNVYSNLMNRIGVNVTLPNQSKDDSLIILFNE